MSTKTTRDTQDEEVDSILSREFDLTASPWAGLHYSYENQLISPNQ
jgi:hypothetical protein